MGDNFHTPYDESTTFKPSPMNAPLGELDEAIGYLKNIIIGCDGTISYNKTTGQITWNDTIHIYFIIDNGDAIENTIAAGNITLSDDEFAYVDLSETDGQAVSMAKAAISTDTESNYKAYNRVVLAYRNADSDELYPVLFKAIWGSAGTTTNFLVLDDTPSSYSGEGGNLVKVASGETALEFDKERKYQTITPGDTPTIDWSLGSTAYILLDRVTTTFTFTGARAGQRLVLICEQDGTGGRAIAFGAEVRGGSDIALPPTLSGAGKVDYLGFIYNNTDSKYDFVALSRGF